MKQKTKSAGPADGGEGISFEKSLRRLEEIVDAIEGGTLNLNEMMKLYEEGVVLSKQCLEGLTQAETKLKRLAKDIDGRMSLVDQPLPE